MGGRCVSGHVVPAVRLGYVTGHRNALTERAWKDAVQGLGKKRARLTKCRSTSESKQTVFPGFSTRIIYGQN